MKNDKLQKKLKETPISKRVLIWIWTRTNEKTGLLHNIKINTPNARDILLDKIEIAKFEPEDIHKKFEELLLNENEIKWISNSKRQYNFIKNELSNVGGGTIWIDSIMNNNDLDFKESSTLMLDMKEILKLKKSKLNEHIKSKWENISHYEKGYEWFEKEETNEKIATARQILLNSKKYYFNPDQIKTKEDLLIILDTVKAHELEYQILLEKIKKRWSQNKYRRNIKDGKICSFKISNNTIKKLEKLSTKHNINKSQIIEILIHMEYEKSIYIEEIKKLQDTLIKNN